MTENINISFNVDISSYKETIERSKQALAGIHSEELYDEKVNLLFTEIAQDVEKARLKLKKEICQSLLSALEEFDLEEIFID